MPADPDALFADFAPVPREDWMDRVRADLKDRPVETLDWDTGAGFALRPFHRADDLTDLPHLAEGARPLHRTTRTGPGWRLRERLRGDAPSDLADDARRAVDGGAEVLELPLTGDAARIVEAVREAAPDARLLLEPPGDPNEVMRTLEALRDVDLDGCRVGIDPYASGRFDLSLLPAQYGAASLRDAWLTLDARRYRRYGVDPVLELALLLAALTDAADALTDVEGIRAGDLFERVQLIVPAETRVLLTIAKLRALRLLVGRLAGAFGVDEAPPVTLHAVTDTWDQTRYAPYTNLVRHSLKAAGAVLGGCDTLRVTAHDALGTDGTDEGRRLARNVGLLLRHEARLDAPADPAGGAYHVEVATDRIARGAWERFRSIEASGGLLEAQGDGSLGALLATHAAAAQENVATRRHVLVGTNHFPHDEPSALSPAAPDPHRAAAAWEAMRARTERHAEEARRPATALLLPVGDPRLRTARAAFARGVFGSASFRVAEADPADSPEALDARLFADAPEVVVACSSDEAYPELVEHLARLRAASRAQTLLVVAGRPPELAERLTEAGADAFIHLGMDALAMLSRLQDRLGFSA